MRGISRCTFLNYYSIYLCRVFTNIIYYRLFQMLKVFTLKIVFSFFRRNLVREIYIVCVLSNLMKCLL